LILVTLKKTPPISEAFTVSISEWDYIYKFMGMLGDKDSEAEEAVDSLVALEADLLVALEADLLVALEADLLAPVYLEVVLGCKAG